MHRRQFQFSFVGHHLHTGQCSLAVPIAKCAVEFGGERAEHPTREADTGIMDLRRAVGNRIAAAWSRAAG